jgi:hypothetical protein
MRLQVMHVLVAPGEPFEIPEFGWIVSAEVEEGGKIRVVAATQIWDEEV